MANGKKDGNENADPAKFKKKNGSSMNNGKGTAAINSDKINKTENDTEVSDVAFGNDKEIDTILGCTEQDSELLFLVKWKNDTTAQTIPAKVANVKYPEKVIAFYEKRIVWDDPI